MKFLDKFYNNANVPWVQLTWSKLYHNDQTPPHARCPVGSFWWKDVLKLFEKFKQFSTCQPNRGNSILLWSDIWIDQTLRDKFPHLFSFSRKPKCSVRFFINTEMERMFRLPLPNQAALQLQNLELIIQNANWDENVNDRWIFSWGTAKYSSRRVYRILIGDSPTPPLSQMVVGIL